MEVFFTIVAIGFISLFLAIGSFIAEYIFPRIPVVNRFLDRFESE